MIDHRTNIFLDIETIPGNTFMNTEVADTIKPPGNIKKVETLKAWEEETKPGAVESAVRALALHPAYCQIVALSWAIDSEDPQTYYGQDERAILDCFMADLRKALEAKNDGYAYRMVGHNITGFDLPVLITRCFVNGVSVAVLPIMQDCKPWYNQRTFDTLYQLSNGNFKGWSLGNCAKLLGLKDDYPHIDGSMVYDLWRGGFCQEVADYCEGDVRLVRQLFHRMADYYL